MIDISQQPLTPDVEAQIYEGLRLYGIERIGYSEKYDTTAFVARKSDIFAGAVVAFSFWGALHIESVYVDNAFRDQGLGTRLMERALTFGREKNFRFAFLETMSFEALKFYQKLGFQLEFTRPGYVYGSSYHYLRKDLTVGK